METKAADLPYRIYDYIDVGEEYVDPYIAPHSINFTTDLSIRLHPIRTFVLGELREVTRVTVLK